jgi:hypothetical protein
VKKKNPAAQLDLFSPETQKAFKVQAVIEQIKKQFGEKAVVSGSQIPANPSGEFKKGKRARTKKGG